MTSQAKPADSELALSRSAVQLDLPVGTLAAEALIAEVLLSPKPGLVDQWDTGAHHDLSVVLMVRSAKALMPFFDRMAEEGRRARWASPGGKAASLESGHRCLSPRLLALRERIGQIGRDAEAQMMRVTKNVNTHRGAIWTLGLLSTAAALDGPHAWSAEDLCRVAGLLARLPDRHGPNPASNGQQMVRRYRVEGAREQARLGFPAILEVALPALHAGRAKGSSEDTARLDALVSLMATLSDTCVLSRAGQAGLSLMHAMARRIMQSGGVATQNGYDQLVELKRRMIAINASPGGAADLLAATLFVDAVADRTAPGVAQ